MTKFFKLVLSLAMTLIFTALMVVSALVLLLLYELLGVTFVFLMILFVIAWGFAYSYVNWYDKQE